MFIEEVLNEAEGIGTYLFLNKRLNRFYVGQSIYLISRVRNHINGSHNNKINDLIDEYDTELYLIFRHDECVECGIYNKFGQAETLNILEVVTYYYFINVGYEGLNAFNRFKTEGYESLSENEKEKLFLLVEDGIHIDLFKLGYKHKVYYEALNHKYIRQKNRLEEQVYKNSKLKDANNRLSQENYKLVTHQSLQQQIMGTVLAVPKRKEQERVSLKSENVHYKQVNEELLGRYKELKESYFKHNDIIKELESKYSALEEKYLNALNESRGTEERLCREELEKWDIRVREYLRRVIELNDTNFKEHFNKFKKVSYNREDYSTVVKGTYAEWAKTMVGFEYLTNEIVSNIDNIDLDESRLWSILRHGVNSRAYLTPIGIWVERIVTEPIAIDTLRSLCNSINDYLKAIGEAIKDLNLELYGGTSEDK